MAFQSESLKKEFFNILNTFTGADGGIRFVKFRMMLERLENDSDDKAAKELLKIVSQFSKLIDIANYEVKLGE